MDTIAAGTYDVVVTRDVVSAMHPAGDRNVMPHDLTAARRALRTGLLDEIETTRCWQRSTGHACVHPRHRVA